MEQNNSYWGKSKDKRFMFFNFCLYFFLNYYFFLDLLGNEKKKVMYGKDRNHELCAKRILLEIKSC